MSDYQDFLDNQGGVSGYSVWDPQTKTNAYAPAGAQAYIAANPTHYQGYTGIANQTPQGGVSADAYVPGVTGTAPKAAPPGQFDPYAFKMAQQRSYLNPYDDRGALTQQQTEWINAVRRIPGGNPTYGVLPGSNLYYDLLHQKEVDPNTLDPMTRLFGGFTQRNPGNIPTLAQSGGPGGVSGRGYRFKGALTPQMQAAQQAAAAGNPQAARWLAQQVGAQWQGNQPSTMQKIARQYYYPALMAVGSLGAGGAGGWVGPVVGGAWGGFASGAASKWQNPAAIAAGAGAGALGGWLGGQGAQALGLGPYAQTLASGATGSAAATLGKQAATGQFDPTALLRNTAIGTGAAAVTGGLQALGSGGYVNTPGEPGGGVKIPANPYVQAIAPSAGNIFGTTASAFWPTTDPREAARQRELARRNPNHPYQR